MRVFDLCLLLALSVVAVHAGEDAGYCRSAGFSSALMCSSCKKLSEFQLSLLQDDCNKCCTPDGDDLQQQEAVVKHPFAVLQVKAFIDQRQSKYPNLKVENVRGMAPRLRLLNDKRELVEELNIEKWNTDTLDEFLATKLQV